MEYMRNLKGRRDFRKLWIKIFFKIEDCKFYCPFPITHRMLSRSSPSNISQKGFCLKPFSAKNWKNPKNSFCKGVCLNFEKEKKRGA